MPTQETPHCAICDRELETAYHTDAGLTVCFVHFTESLCSEHDYGIDAEREIQAADRRAGQRPEYKND